MVYNGMILAGVRNDADLAKLYTVVYDHGRKKTFGKGWHSSEAEAVTSAKAFVGAFETANVYENVFADNTMVFSAVVKTVRKTATA